MSGFTNPLAEKNMQDKIASMVFYLMKRENISLLQASIIVRDLVTDEKTQKLITDKVNEYNGVRE